MKSVLINGECVMIEEPENPSEPQIINTEVAAYRRKYLDATGALCALAGMPYTGKLTNIDYDQALQRAATHPPAGVIAATLLYCRDRLAELEGESWWDNITEL